jgi:FkbM family methyltransferase
MPFIDASVLVVERGMTGATGNIYCGLHEFDDMGFLLHFLRPEDAFFDLGANVGSYTVLASAVVGATSITIEPLQHTYDLLCRNVSANRIEQKVNALQTACSDSPGHLLMTSDLDCMNRIVSADYDGPTSEVPVTTIDNLLSDVSPACWKVDVEGHEEEALAGATASLKSPTLNAIIMEGDSVQLRQQMVEAGFQLMSYNPFTRHLEAVPSKHGSQNHLWVRDLDFVQERCRSARKFDAAGTVI